VAADGIDRYALADEGLPGMAGKIRALPGHCVRIVERTKDARVLHRAGRNLPSPIPWFRELAELPAVRTPIPVAARSRQIDRIVRTHFVSTKN